MNKIKFLHFGDLHLDMPFTAIGEAGFPSKDRRQELKSCFGRIIELARDEKVNIVLISGDLFEHFYVKKSTISYLNDKFKQIPDIKVFIVPGNHDPFVVDSYYMNYLWNENVHILAGDNEKVKLDEFETCIYGAGFKNFYEKESLVAGIRPVEPELINILLVHGTVDMNIGGEKYNPMSSDELENIGMDYIALGHFHTCIKGTGDMKSVYNPGSPEPLGFDEPGEHGVFIGTISKDPGEGRGKADVRFVEISRKYYKTININVGGCGLLEQVVEKINEALSEEDLNRGLFDIHLKGYVKSEFKIDIGYLRDFFKFRVLFMKIKDETSPDFDIEEISKEQGIRGAYTRKFLSLIGKEQDMEKKRLLQDSLYFGLQAIENGEIEFDYTNLDGT